MLRRNGLCSVSWLGLSLKSSSQSYGLYQYIYHCMYYVLIHYKHFTLQCTSNNSIHCMYYILIHYKHFTLQCSFNNSIVKVILGYFFWVKIVMCSTFSSKNNFTLFCKLYFISCMFYFLVNYFFLKI